MILLRKLAQVPSFDVYSLRILLRQQGINVENQDFLKLSPSKTKDLTEYMTGFTYALIKEIYGASDVDIESFDDIILLFRARILKRPRNNWPSWPKN